MIENTHNKHCMKSWCPWQCKQHDQDHILKSLHDMPCNNPTMKQHNNIVHLQLIKLYFSWSALYTNNLARPAHHPMINGLIVLPANNGKSLRSNNWRHTWNRHTTTETRGVYNSTWHAINTGYINSTKETKRLFYHFLCKSDAGNFHTVLSCPNNNNIFLLFYYYY